MDFLPSKKSLFSSLKKSTKKSSTLLHFDDLPMKDKANLIYQVLEPFLDKSNSLKMIKIALRNFESHDFGLDELAK